MPTHNNDKRGTARRLIARTANALCGATLLMLGAACANRPVLVPYLGTPISVAREMLQLAEVKPDELVVDLGSGDGRMVILAAKEFRARGIGIELDPLLVTESRASARSAGVADKVTFAQGDIFETDVKDADVVLLYLGETFNQRLRPRLLAQLKPGARVVSHQFSMGDWKPDAERRVDDSVIYLWRIR